MMLRKKISIQDNIYFCLMIFILLNGCSVPFENEPLYYPTAVQSYINQAKTADSNLIHNDVQNNPNQQLNNILKLDDCIQLAMKNYRPVNIADRKVLMAQDVLNEAWTANMPKINATGKFELREKEQSVAFGGNNIVLSEANATSGAISAEMLIYDFGRTEKQRDALREGIHISQLNATKTRQNIKLGVSQIYFRILEAEKMKTVVEESLQVIEEQLKIAKDFLSQGLVNKSDVLALEVRLEERKQELISITNQFKIAVATLNRFTGLDIEHETKIEDVLEVEPWNDNYISLLQKALKQRPDLIALERQIVSAQAEYASIRANYFPIISAFGNYSATTESSFGSSDSGRLVGGLVVQVPIFDGGVTHRKLQRKEKEIAEIRDTRDEHVDNIALEVKKAFLKLQEAAEKIPVARKSIELADENLRINRDQYGQGLVTSATVLIEADHLSSARANYYRALYDYHQAFAQLIYEIGDTPTQK